MRDVSIPIDRGVRDYQVAEPISLEALVNSRALLIRICGQLFSDKQIADLKIDYDKDDIELRRLAAVIAARELQAADCASALFRIARDDDSEIVRGCALHFIIANMNSLPVAEQCAILDILQKLAFPDGISLEAMEQYWSGIRGVSRH